MKIKWYPGLGDGAYLKNFFLLYTCINIYTYFQIPGAMVPHSKVFIFIDILFFF